MSTNMSFEEDKVNIQVLIKSKYSLDQVEKGDKILLLT
jgi:hypothetical protein